MRREEFDDLLIILGGPQSERDTRFKILVEYDALCAERDDLQKRLEDANGEIEHLRDTRQDPFDTIEVLRSRVDGAEVVIVQLRGELYQAHERIAELTEQANAAYAPYRERVMTAREEVNKLSGKLRHAREAIAGILAELHDNDPLKPNCLDCGKPYEDFPMDVVLSDEQWQMIHPDKNGLLCADCIVKRASRLPGAYIVRMIIEF
jgi:predicted  nucleic acid-binding Zn-ribbon protein